MEPQSFMRSERLGLMIIGMSLIAMLLVAGTLSVHQIRTRAKQIREQGLGLAQVMSKLPFDHWKDLGSNADVLGQVRRLQASHFAYSAVVDRSGQALAVVTADGLHLPARELDTSSSSGIETLQTSAEGRSVQEFMAPILTGGELKGYVRIGYFQPAYGLDAQQLSFLAVIVSPIFLFAVLCYVLVKRELATVQTLDVQIRDRIAGYLGNQEPQTDVRALNTFSQRLEGFLEMTDVRIKGLETSQSNLQLTTNLLTYKRSKIESVLQALPQAVMIFDEAGLLTFANAKLETLLGTSVESMQGQSPESWCQDPSLLKFLTNLQRGAGTRSYGSALDFTPAHAPDKHLNAAAFPLFSPNDATTRTGTLVVLSDVTMSVLVDKARGEFVAHLAHELKSPLHVLRMYSEALLGEDGNQEAFRVEAVNVIHDEVDRLAALVNNLLNIHKIEMGSLALNLQRTRLRDLLQDIFDALSRAGNEQAVEFKNQLPRELSPVAVDKDLFRIAVNNLLTNAIKYNRPGGSVTLTAEETPDAITITVQDTGVGIAPEDQSRIFDKFYRVAGQEQQQVAGHGLGLALARQIVEMHHGKLTVDSKPGSGTAFTITLTKSHRLVQEALRA